MHGTAIQMLRDTLLTIIIVFKICLGTQKYAGSLWHFLGVVCGGRGAGLYPVLKKQLFSRDQKHLLILISSIETGPQN